MPAVATARQYLEHAATRLDVDPNSTECLKHPAAIHEVTVPSEKASYQAIRGRNPGHDRAEQRHPCTRYGDRFQDDVVDHRHLQQTRGRDDPDVVTEKPVIGAVWARGTLGRSVALTARKASDYDDDPLEETAVAV